MKPRTVTHTQHPSIKAHIHWEWGPREGQSHLDNPHLRPTVVHSAEYPPDVWGHKRVNPTLLYDTILPFLMNSSVPCAERLLQPPSLVSASLFFLPSPTSTSPAKKMAASHPPDGTQNPADLMSKEHIIHNIVINHRCIIHQGRDLATGPAFFDPFEQENESIHRAGESKGQS